MVLDINKILENFQQEYYEDTFEVEEVAPCYQAKFENSSVTFLIDGKDVITLPVGERSLSYTDIKETLCNCFNSLKKNDVKQLKKYWNAK